MLLFEKRLSLEDIPDSVETVTVTVTVTVLGVPQMSVWDTC